MIPHFEAAATELIEAKGAVQALAAALARLTNQHGAIKVAWLRFLVFFFFFFCNFLFPFKTRSLLASHADYTTILCTSRRNPIHSPV